MEFSIFCSKIHPTNVFKLCVIYSLNHMQTVLNFLSVVESHTHSRHSFHRHLIPYISFGFVRHRYFNHRDTGNSEENPLIMCKVSCHLWRQTSFQTCITLNIYNLSCVANTNKLLYKLLTQFQHHLLVANLNILVIKLLL